MGQVIEVDFVHHEILEGVDDFDREVGRLIDDYHLAVELGGVAFDELDEEFREFARAVGR